MGPRGPGLPLSNVRVMERRGRTGPIGRLVRLVWLLAGALTLASLVDASGTARFRNPHVLSEPSAWVLHALMVVAFVVLAGAIGGALGGEHAVKRVQTVAVLILVAAVALLAGLGQLISGAVWGFPLADAVWTFDIGMLAQEIVAFAAAIALGTPGCEVGVWAELIAPARGSTASRTDVPCVIGLQLLDRWESARRAKTPP